LFDYSKLTYAYEVVLSPTTVVIINKTFLCLRSSFIAHYRGHHQQNFKEESKCISQKKDWYPFKLKKHRFGLVTKKAALAGCVMRSPSKKHQPAPFAHPPWFIAQRCYLSLTDINIQGAVTISFNLRQLTLIIFQRLR